MPSAATTTVSAWESRFKRPDPLWREAVGETLRRRRSDAGLRLVDVAKRAGVSPQHLFWRSSAAARSSSEVLAAVAGALDPACAATRDDDGGRGHPATPAAAEVMCLAA